MKVINASIDVATTKSAEMVNITQRVKGLVRNGGITDGLCCVTSSHTTAGLTLNENTDPNVQRDILTALERAVPKEAGYYKHEEGNAHAHVKASLMGFSLTIPIQGGRLLLGTWQAIFLAEFDGPRARKVSVTLLG